MTDFVLPTTHYAISAEASIAYQVMGDGPVDIVLVPGVVSHVEFLHELPGYTAFLRRLSHFARVITFDKRGQGLSDRMSGAPSLEQRMDDVRAVMDDAGSRQAVLLGFSEGCPMSALFAATYPERVSHLVLIGGFACAADRVAQDVWDANLPRIIRNWGSGDLLKIALGGQAADDGLLARVAKLERLSSSPGAFKEIMLLNRQIDVRPILPTVRVPTLVLHRATDAQMPVRLGRDLASQIPGAKYLEYPDGDHAFWTGDVETTLGDIEEFVTGHREAPQDEFERVLATVLFTDIVDSTRRAVASGDHSWRKLLDRHDELAKEAVEKHRGVLVKTTGDGILATFDGPGRAVRCALTFGAASRQIGLPVRAGLHTGEIEIRGNDIGGIAVHAAARVMAQSDASEVLVSRVITDLVAGAGLKFAERGTYELKGLPGRWDLFAASV